MTHPRFSGSIGEPARFLALLAGIGLAVGCGDSDDDGPAQPRNTDMSLDEACAASCTAQARTYCPDVLPPGQCTDLCISFPERLPACAQAWTNINACMANAPLFCDRVNGGAAVRSEHCASEIDQMATCMQ
jgi:hypothetical protein